MLEVNARARSRSQSRISIQQSRTNQQSNIAKSSTCQGEGVDQSPSLVQGLAVLLFGIGIGNDTAPCTEVYAAVAGDCGADGNARVEVAGHAEVADRAAVDAALGQLELGDDFHRTELGRSRDRSARKRRAQQV